MITKVLVTVDVDVLARIDAFADSLSLSRSAFLSMAAIDYMNAKEKAPLITSAFSSLAALIDSRVKGEISQEDFQSRIDNLNHAVKEISK